MAYIGSMCDIYRALQDEISVPVVKTAKWLPRHTKKDYLWSECSNCGFKEEHIKTVVTGISSTDYVGVRWDYCPKCGSKMSV